MSVWGYILAIFFIVAPSAGVGVFLNWKGLKRAWVWGSRIVKRSWNWCKSFPKNSWNWCKRALASIIRNFAIISASVLFVAIFVLLGLFFYQRLYPLIDSLYDLAKNQIYYINIFDTGFRNISLSIGGSITLSIALLGVILTVIRNILTHKQNKTEEERLVTEQISRAIDQIGAYKQTANGKFLESNIEVRLGGLYSLQRIMRNSLKDELTIAKIFSAYVRENANKNEVKKKDDQPREDVQTALDILNQFNKVRRKQGKKDFHTNLSRVDFKGYSIARIDFSGFILRDVIFSDRILFKTNFSKAQLNNADFSKTKNLMEVNFSNATLYNANLSGATLIKINFSNAILYETNLSNTHLFSTDLSKTHLSRVNLSGAFLFDADLSGANLHGANLEGANLSTVKNLTQEQVDEAKGNKKTRLPKGLTHPDSWKPKKKPAKKIKTVATKTAKPATKTKKPATKVNKTKKPATKANKTQKPATKVKKTQKSTTKAKKTP